MLSLWRLVRIQSIAESFARCMLADALGVLTLYAICDDSADMRAAMLRAFPQAYNVFTGNPDDDASMARPMEAALCALRGAPLPTIYVVKWSSLPASLVFQACMLQDGQFLQAIHHVLDMHRIGCFDTMMTWPLHKWLDDFGTYDKATGRVLEILVRRKAIKEAAQLTPKREAEVVEFIVSPAGVERLYKHSHQIMCQEFFRARPHRITDVTVALATALRSVADMDINDKLMRMEAFLDYSWPGNDIGEMAVLYDTYWDILQGRPAPESPVCKT